MHSSMISWLLPRRNRARIASSGIQFLVLIVMVCKMGGWDICNLPRVINRPLLSLFLVSPSTPLPFVYENTGVLSLLGW